MVQHAVVSKPPLQIRSSSGIRVGVMVGLGVLVRVDVLVGVVVAMGVAVAVGVFVGVLVGVVVAVAVAVGVGVGGLVGVSEGVLVGVVEAVAVAVGVGVRVLVGVAVAVPVVIRLVGLIRVLSVAVDMFAGAAGTRLIIAPAFLASRGAVSALVDSRDRNTAISASAMIALLVLIDISFKAASLLSFRQRRLKSELSIGTGDRSEKHCRKTVKVV
jgi:hypothetical protein